MPHTPPTPLASAKQTLSDAWTDLQSGLRSNAPPDLEAKLTAVDRALTTLLTHAHEPSSEAGAAKYASFDEWSRHFSNVRMTVVPFGITTAIAVLAWGWDRQEAVFVNTFPPHGLALFPLLALIVWLASMLLMLGITYQTYKWGARMLEQAGIAGISPPLAPDKSISKADRGLTSHLRFVLTKTDALRDVPLWCTILASIGFLLAWRTQHLHFDGQSKPTDIHIVTDAPKLTEHQTPPDAASSSPPMPAVDAAATSQAPANLGPSSSPPAGPQ